jgi:hypothetical protein
MASHPRLHLKLISYLVEILVALAVGLVPGVVHTGLPVSVGVPAHGEAAREARQILITKRSWRIVHLFGARTR